MNDDEICELLEVEIANGEDQLSEIIQRTSHYGLKNRGRILLIQAFIDTMEKQALKQRGRNVSSLMQTVGRRETQASMGNPRNENSTMNRQSANTLSHIGSFLSGKKGTIKMQQIQLHENITRPGGKPGVGVGGKKSKRNSRKNRSTMKKRRSD